MCRFRWASTLYSYLLGHSFIPYSCGNTTNPASHLLKQLGLEAELIDLDDFTNFQLFDVAGSIISKELFESAREFAQEIITLTLDQMKSNDNTHYSASELFDQNIKKHELYSDLHSCHLRIIHWYFALLEFRSDMTLESITQELMPDASKKLYIPGGLGQITHGLAYGTKDTNDSYYSIETFCGRRITKIMDSKDGDEKIEVEIGNQNFRGDYVVLAVPRSVVTVMINLCNLIVQ